VHFRDPHPRTEVVLSPFTPNADEDVRDGGLTLPR
jgi:hypothetical protein